MRTGLILPRLHVSAVQVAIESSQVPRGIHTVTKSHFAQEILTDMGAFDFQRTAFTSIFSTKLCKVSLVLSPSLWVCVCVCV